MLTKHIQNPAVGHYSAIFRILCNACIREKPGILGILEYSEPFHNCILMLIRNPVKQEFAYIQNSDIFKT